MTGLDNQPGSVFPWSASLALDTGGALQLQGNLGVLPSLDLAAALTMENLDLTVLQPFVDRVAPFRLPGALVGGDAEAELGSIRFRAGRADLAPPERQILEQLREALSQRPELVLEIPLLATESDRQALQASLVAERINQRIDQLPDGESSLTDRRVAVLETLYGEAGLQPELAAVQLANQVETSVTNPLTGEPLISKQLDVQAYVADLRGRLVAVEPISEDQLAGLAQARRDAVRQYLLTDGQLPDTQLADAAAQSVEPDDDGWLMMEFGLEAGTTR